MTPFFCHTVNVPRTVVCIVVLATAANDGCRGIEGGIAQSTDAHLHTHYSSGEIGGHFDRIEGGVP